LVEETGVYLEKPPTCCKSLTNFISKCCKSNMGLIVFFFFFFFYPSGKYWVLTLRACPFCTAKSKSYIQLKTEWAYLHLTDLLQVTDKLYLKMLYWVHPTW
jgi:hypothetical protein